MVQCTQKLLKRQGRAFKIEIGAFKKKAIKHYENRAKNLQHSTGGNRKSAY
jgi:hypothetical protein